MRTSLTHWGTTMLLMGSLVACGGGSGQQAGDRSLTAPGGLPLPGASAKSNLTPEELEATGLELGDMPVGWRRERRAETNATRKPRASTSETSTQTHDDDYSECPALARFKNVPEPEAEYEIARQFGNPADSENGVRVGVEQFPGEAEARATIDLWRTSATCPLPGIKEIRVPEVGDEQAGWALVSDDPAKPYAMEINHVRVGSLVITVSASYKTMRNADVAEAALRRQTQKVEKALGRR